MLKGGRIFDLVSGELVKSDVAICSDRIVGTMGEYRGEREIDVTRQGRRSRVSSTRIATSNPRSSRRSNSTAACSRHGVTTSICDPHEIANVLGLDGPALLPRRGDADRDGLAHAALELRSRDRARDFGRSPRGG